MERRLPTGCRPIDEALGGGFRYGWVSLIYGEPVTGKTTLALVCAANHLGADPAAKVYYVDADNKLSPSRLSQIAGEGSGATLRRLLVWRPRDFDEQGEVIESLQTILPRGELAVVDSVTGLYRVEAGDPSRTFQANKELNRQLGLVSEMAKTSGCAFLLTGQVRSALDSEYPQVEPVAQRLLRFWSDAVLRLDPTPMRGVRQATVEKPGGRGACRFTIGPSGITGEGAP